MRCLPVILAAGKGTRMRSSLPKVLHPIAGKPMLQHVVDMCGQLNQDRLVVVYGHGGDQVPNALHDTDHIIHWMLQQEQLGTGHALMQALEVINDDDLVLVAYGDVPLVRTETLQALSTAAEQASLSILTTRLEQPTGYGRIVRNTDGFIESIIEEKDATDEIRCINEVNTGFMAATGSNFKRWLEQITPNNAQGEYYLTDCVALAVAEGGHVAAVVCPDPVEVQGVNNRLQQAQLERAYQLRQANALMEAGVTLMDPARIDIRGELTAGNDVTLDINIVIKGKVTLGHNVVVGPNCILENCHIADGVTIHANSIIESAEIANHCNIGPFARLRPGTILSKNARIGNFVEIKKSHIGEDSKVNHLSYIGDSQMGARVNIGAGTITCNYDGVNKHQTIIGDDVFVGSSSQLVAPVTLGNKAMIGAGSTITKDASADSLTLSRAKQLTLKGWQRPTKK